MFNEWEKTCSAAAEKRFKYEKPNQTFGVRSGLGNYMLSSGCTFLFKFVIGNSLHFLSIVIQYDNYQVPFIKTRLKLSHLKGSGKKQRKNVKKILVVAGDSNPGPLALATSALTTELRQPSTSKTFTFSFILLSSTACCSLVLNRPPIMCRQNTFSVSTRNTSPSGEEP